MKKRWASDIGYGLLIAAVGALGAAVSVAFWPAGVPFAVAVLFLGAAISLFGGFEFFMTRD